VINTKTSFTQPTNSFEIGMFTLKLNHHLGKFSTTADIGIGNRAEQFNYTSKIQVINQTIIYRLCCNR
jgi:hypothetical protein